MTTNTKVLQKQVAENLENEMVDIQKDIQDIPFSALEKMETN